MKQLLKEWNEFLNEISFDDAKKVLDSKRTYKIIKGYHYDNPDMIKGAWPGQSDEQLLNNHFWSFKEQILSFVPDDIEGTERGEALLWLIGLARKDKKFLDDVVANRSFPPLKNKIKPNLEYFFQWKDLNLDTSNLNTGESKIENELGKIDSMFELVRVGTIAAQQIRKNNENKIFLDADEGEETLRDDSGWKISIVSNKGAACHLGKGTDWCTAAPGLDYFEKYYKPDDPLFYFLNKKTGEKYQFHYGTEQFKNKDDLNISEIDKEMGTNVANTLHKMLFATSAGEKYPVVAKYKNTVLANDPETDTEELRKLYDEGIFNTDLAKNPSTPADILLKFAESKHAPIRRFVASNKGAPPEALIKLAEDLFLMVRTAVAENTSTPVDVLKKMKDDNHGYISRLAAKVLKNRESKQQGELSESILNLWQKIIS